MPQNKLIPQEDDLTTPLQNRKRRRVKHGRWPKTFVSYLKEKNADLHSLLEELRRIYEDNDPVQLHAFAQQHNISYAYLRALAARFNTSIHTSRTMVGPLTKAVRQINEMGIINPMQVEKDSLWRAWVQAVDQELG